MFGGTEGPLLDELQSVGVQVGDIDTFFLTNLHLDHVGWNISRNGTGSQSPTFPNARYVAHESDWGAFNTPRDSEIFGFDWWSDTLAPLREVGVLDLVSGDTELTAQLTITPLVP